MSEDIFKIKKQIVTEVVENRSLLSMTIKKYRKLKDLTQTQAAKELKVSRTALTNWETGESIPSAQNIVAMSNLYNITPNDLLGF